MEADTVEILGLRVKVGTPVRIVVRGRGLLFLDGIVAGQTPQAVLIRTPDKIVAVRYTAIRSVEVAADREEYRRLVCREDAHTEGTDKAG